MLVLQGLRQRLLQTESALREAQAKRDAEAASCSAMAERLQSGESFHVRLSVCGPCHTCCCRANGICQACSGAA
jgi:hypothetical protein